MIVVMTNNGNWESDTMGVVGVLNSLEELGAFVEKHGTWSKGGYELVGEQPALDFLEASEIDLIAEGEVIGAAIMWEAVAGDDGIYVAVAFPF